jgi:hypothetical protein
MAEDSDIEEAETRSRGGRKGITDEQIIKALFKSGGIVAQAARALGVRRDSLAARIKNSTRLLEAELEAVERVLDLAESTLIKGIKSGDQQSARWFLDRKGGKRGYRHRVEHAGPGGGAIPVANTNVGIPADKLSKEDLDLARRRYFDNGDD